MTRWRNDAEVRMKEAGENKESGLKNSSKEVKVGFSDLLCAG